MKGVLQILVSFFITVGCIVQLIPACLNIRRDVYSPENEEAIRLNAVLIADMHTDANPVRDRNNIIRRSLSGISRCSDDLDALVIAGDITNSGSEKEYFYLSGMLKVYNKTEFILPEIGNHDSRGTSEDKDYETAAELFLRFCNESKIATERVYYSSQINGYYFISLGTEKALENEAFISQEQLEWLNETLSLAENSG